MRFVLGHAALDDDVMTFIAGIFVYSHAIYYFKFSVISLISQASVVQ